MEEIDKISVKGTMYAMKDATARQSIEKLNLDGMRLKGVVRVYPYTLNSGWSPDTTAGGMIWPLSEMPADGDLYAMPFGNTPLLDNEGSASMLEIGARPVVKGDIYRYDAATKTFQNASPLFDGTNLTGTGSAGVNNDTYIAGEDMPEDKAAAFGLSSVSKGDILVWDGNEWQCFSGAVDTELDADSDNAVANSAVTAELNKMYKNTYSLSASPSIVETGVEAEITLTYTAKSETYGGSTTKHTVASVSKLNDVGSSDTTVASYTSGTSNGYTTHKLSLTPTANGSHTIYSTVKFSDGTEKSLTAAYSSQHYMYFGSAVSLPLSDSNKLTYLTRQALANSPAKNGVKVAVKKGQYLMLCVPSNMSISLVKDANTNIEIQMYSYTAPETLTFTESGGEVEYKVYRSMYTLNDTETLTLNIS